MGMLPLQSRAASLRFGPFAVDLRAGELWKGERAVRLPDKPFRLLALLLERPGELVTREEIRERLWGSGAHVELDDSLNHAVRTLRKALGDSAEKPRYLETLPKRGYRFIGAMHFAPGAVPPVAFVRKLPARRLPSRGTVGRDAQLAAMEQIFDEARSGRGWMLGLRGEPGMGKTTLIESFIERVREQGCHVALGRCSERFAGTEAYLPVMEALESLIDDRAECREALIRKAPAWFGQLAPCDAAPDASLGPVIAEARGASQERRKREFHAFLQAISRDRPVVFFLDDIHWADEFTVDLLAYLSARCNSMGVLLGGSFRPSDLLLSRHPFEQVRLELQTRRLYREIDLPPLREEDIAGFLDLEFPSHRFPPELAEWLNRQTEGNALFVVDLVRDLRASGVLERKADGWRMAGTLPGRAAVPDSIRGMVQRKLSKLAEVDRRLLEAASVHGHEFRSVAVSGALGLDHVEVERRFRELETTHRLITCQGLEELSGSTVSLRFRFAHALYQDALCGELSPTDLASLSARAARALESAFSDSREGPASELAYLYEAAREWEKAADYFLAAAQQAANRQANPTALALCRRAMAMAERLSGAARDGRVLRAAFQLSRAHQAMSQFAEAVADYRLAQELAARLGDHTAMLEAMTGTGVCAFYMRNVPEVAMVGGKTWELAEAEDSRVGRACARTLLALDGFCRGDLNAMRSHLDEAAPVLENAEPPLTSVLAIGFRAFLHALQSEYEASEPLFIRALTQAQAAGLPCEVIRIHWQRGIALANRGLFHQALAALGEGWRLAELNQEAYWIARFPNTIAWVHEEMLDEERALVLNTEGISISRKVGFSEAEANSRINLALFSCRHAELDAAAGHLEECERILNCQDEKVWLRWRFNIRLRSSQGVYWLARGDLDRARAATQEALRLAESALARKYVALAQKTLGDIARRSGQRAQAAACYLAGLAAIENFPCPLVEWRLLPAAAACAPEDARAESWRARALRIVTALSQQVPEPASARRFLESAQAEIQTPR